jgi:hypothetical protein
MLYGGHVLRAHMPRVNRASEHSSLSNDSCRVCHLNGVLRMTVIPSTQFYRGVLGLITSSDLNTQIGKAHNRLVGESQTSDDG